MILQSFSKQYLVLSIHKVFIYNLLIPLFVKSLLSLSSPTSPLTTPTPPISLSLSLSLTGLPCVVRPPVLKFTPQGTTYRNKTERRKGGGKENITLRGRGCMCFSILMFSSSSSGYSFRLPLYGLLLNNDYSKPNRTRRTVDPVFPFVLCNESRGMTFSSSYSQRIALPKRIVVRSAFENARDDILRDPL